jgi:arylesterase / paraoxonase
MTLKRILVILVLVVIFFVVKLYYQSGQFKSIENHFNGKVTKVYNNVPGPEDMQIDHLTGNLFISGTNRRSTNGETSADDGIYLLNVDSAGNPALLANDYAGDFHPHGLSLLRKDTTLYLFVVNHNKEGDFVELFLYQDHRLKHLFSYSAPELCCPNDVVAVDIDKFYVTNDHGSKAGIMPVIEDYLRVPRSTVLYYNGSSFTVAAKSLYYANGINISHDHKELYLATTTGSSIIVFDREEDGGLHQRFIIDLGTGVDNIDVDEAGDLWIAAHPKLLDFVNHAKDSTRNSPSQVIKLTLSGAHDFTETTVYLNDGSEISGSSVAAYYHNELFIGAVYDNTMLRASLKQ